MNIFDEGGGLMPHGMCFLWNANLLALHVISDALIALAYYSIPLVLLFFIRKRSDLPFARVFVMFGLFIVACGTTHLLDIWTIWHPTYWLSGSLKAVTAVVSVATAILLARIVPGALSLKSPAELAAVNRQLAGSELRYRTLTDAMPQMVGILDAHGTLSYANKQWYAYTGALLDDTGLARLSRFVHPDDGAQASVLLERTRSSRDNRVECRIRRSDDTYRWHAVRVVPLQDEQGVTEQWMFTCADIEDQHAARAALQDLNAQLVTYVAAEHAANVRLREKNRLLSMAEETAHVGHWRFDIFSNGVFWSDEVYRTFGLPMTYRPGLQEAILVYHPEDRELVNACVEEAITEGTPFSFEARIVRPDGEIRHVVSAGQSEHAADQTVLAIFGVLQDVTESKDAERDQRRLIERFDAATRAAQVGIWDWDIANNAIAWNPVMFALHGAAESQFAPSCAAWATIHPDDLARAERELARAAAGEGAFDTEFRAVWPAGEVRNIRAIATLMRNAAGAPTRLIGTSWDITELRSLAEQLRSERALSSWLNGG